MSNGMENFGIFTSAWYDMAIRMQADRDGREQFCSCSGRCSALRLGLSFVVLSPVASIFAAVHFFGRDDWMIKDYFKDRPCIAWIDVTVTILISPLIFLVAAIRGICAAVFHPGLAFYHWERESEKKQMNADQAALKEQGGSAVVAGNA